MRADGVSGRSPDQLSVLWLPVMPSDAMIACTLNLVSAQCVGLVWRWDGSKGDGVMLTHGERKVAIVEVTAGAGGGASRLVDDVEGVNMADSPPHLRVLVRGHRAEVYVNDCWLFGISLTDSPACGGIGLLVDRGAALFSQLRVAELEPML